MAQGSDARARHWAPFLIALLLFLAAVLPELPALHGAFQWDDEELHITKNANIHDAAGLLRTWTSPTANVQFYPLAITVFWCEYHLFGLQELAGYHLVNFLLHGVNTLLVWRLLKRLKVPWPEVAALLFAIHPITVESVAYISEVKNLLSGFFFLGATHLWLSWQERREEASGKAVYLLMLLSFAAAMFSKSVTCTFPVAMLIVEYGQKGRISRRAWIGSMPLLVIAAALAALFIHMEHLHVGATGSAFTFSLLERVLIAGRAACFYPALFVWPVHLVTAYPRWPIDAGNAWQYLYPAAVVLAVGGLWAMRARLGRGPLVMALLYLTLMAPALGWVSYYPMLFTFVANHYAYLALVPLAVGVITGVERAVVGIKRAPLGIAAVVTAVLLVLILAPLTLAQAAQWRTTVSLWEPTVAQNPESWYATSNLAYAYLQNGRYAEAADMAERSLTLHPENPRCCFSLGGARLGLHEYAQAAEAFRQGLAGENTNSVAWFNYALCLDTLKDVDGAEAAYRRTLEIDPRQAHAWNNLATLLLHRAAYREAATAAGQAVQIDPQYGHAHANLGMALERLQQFSKAAQELEAALSLMPENPRLRLELARTDARSNNIAMAVQEYQRVLAEIGGDAGVQAELEAVQRSSTTAPTSSTHP